ncbi:MAG: RecX family transcriptional regulator, partial [Anaerolineae bacterium]|nr:RecX family transcriptional regulator [Anaerolineae bacterium]
ERVNVFLDDEFAFAVTLTVAATLRKDQHLDDEEIEHLKQGDQRNKAYDRALRFLGFRPRSVSEMKKYLANKKFLPDVIEDTIARLTEQQYLDDHAFAQFWLENREQFKPRGQRALRYELRQKGISDQIIDATLTDLNEDELAWAAVERKLNAWKKLPHEALKKKVIGFLSRRGFNYEVAHSVVQRVQASIETDETDEIDDLERPSIDLEWD